MNFVLQCFAVTLSAAVLLPIITEPVQGKSVLKHGDYLVEPLATASPRLRFHLGEVANNQPLISPILPDMPYPPSAYYIAQWQQASYIQPTILTKNDSATYDNRLGVARYAFEAPDGHAHVWIYSSGDSWVYELYEAGGTLRPGGGSNIFLTSDNFASDATFDGTIIAKFDAKLSRAGVHASSAAQTSGAVLGMAFAGFNLLYTDPKTALNQHIFMQIPIALSREQSLRKATFYCKDGSVYLFSPDLFGDETILPFASDSGPLHRFSYVLNGYVRDLLSAETCATMPWPTGARDLANWRLGGFYIGLETENESALLAPLLAPTPQGNIEIGLQITALQIRRQ